MITQKMYGVREVLVAMAVALALILVGASTTFAQTTSYTPPSGYSGYGGYGAYYNSSTGMYYNPMTGQTTTLAPLGPAARNASGAYIVGAGYSPFGNTGSYYNSATGYYYDPTTGFYSTTIPVSTGVTQSSAIAGPGTTYTPGLPNTGMGGEAAKTSAVLVMSALIVAAGVTLLRKKEQLQA